MTMLRFVVVVVLWLPLPAVVFAALQLLALAQEIPEVPDLGELQPTYGTRVETSDGWFLGGAEVARSTPYDELPPRLVAAVIAAEDENFFTHSAFSLRGIVRAAVENYRGQGKRQGASTITQQVARQFLSNEKTYQRKMKELLLARRLEATHTKEQILATYLDTVFLGHRAYGVTAASWYYFGKPPRALELSEMATLAGILPAPSRFNPYEDLELATRARNRVLRRMHELAMISKREHDAARATPLVAGRAPSVEPERMPRAVYAAQRYVRESQGEKAWGERSQTVVVPHVAAEQALARRALYDGVVALDRRQGWRKAPARASDADAVDAALKAQPDDARYALARVHEVSAREAIVVSARGREILPLASSKWAEPASTPRHFKRPVELKDLRRILAPDDVVYVERVDETLVLHQPPAYEGALLAVDTFTGEPRAAVGSIDPERDEFDRTFLGCRQPGSVFKPVVFAEAISSRLSAATMLSDVPVEVPTGRGGVWRPRNADRDFKGYITLANALAWSRNIPTVNLMEHLGPRRVVDRAKRLGIRSPIDPTSSASLGASCVRPWEIAIVYAAFQRDGKTVEVPPIGYVIDAAGIVHEDQLHFSRADFSTAARLDRIARPYSPPSQGVTRQVAFIMNDLLRRVVTSGTASDLADEWSVAGKTGTTNAFDGWFVGYDGRRTAVVWVGSDQNERALGRGEHGATVALPIFEDYYRPFARRDDGLPGDPPEGIEYHRIDPSTGLLAPEGEWGVEYPFLAGTAPREHSPSRGTRQAQKLDELQYEF